MNVNLVDCDLFKVEVLSDHIKSEMLIKKTWNEQCPVAPDRLHRVIFAYYDFEGQPHQNGEIVVMDAIAARTCIIFKQLYDQKFPIAKAKCIEHYNGDDDKSMADNNCSAFNCRQITGGGSLSLHAYGLAIDINPVQNPYVACCENDEQGTIKIAPAQGWEFLNRTNKRPGMTESIKNIFFENGLTVWGGDWNSPIDWQHFQVFRPLAQLLAVASCHHSQLIFEASIKSPAYFALLDDQHNEYVEQYLNDTNAFMGRLI